MNHLGDVGFFAKPESWLAIVTAGTAIVAIWQTRKQIALSNKQHLLDRRIDSYILASSFVENYKDAKSKIDLENIEGTLDNFLHSILFRTEILDMRMFDIPDDYDSYLNDLNGKLVSMRRSATEIPIIFKNAEAELVSLFIESLSYSLLSSITYMTYLKVPAEKIKETNVDINQLKNDLVYNFNKLEKLYDTIIEAKAMENLAKQIKLK